MAELYPSSTFKMLNGLKLGSDLRRMVVRSDSGNLQSSVWSAFTPEAIVSSACTTELVKPIGAFFRGMLASGGSNWNRVCGPNIWVMRLGAVAK